LCPESVTHVANSVIKKFWLQSHIYVSTPNQIQMIPNKVFEHMKTIKQVPVRKIKRVFVNPAYKDKGTLLESAEETGGRYTLAELEVYPGGGNHMHIHKAFEETFIGVKGRLGLVLNGTKRYLYPGESITVPKNAPHRFFNDGDTPAVCHIRFVPGHDGFQKGIAIAYGLASDGMSDSKGTPKKLIHLALLVRMTDTYPVGPLALLVPLLRMMSNTKRARQMEKELVEKYCYED
jgi:mannose-6-phosphate isomerase-like protein (cupin superfamily)